MIVVFDTNVWKSELYLQSPSAAAVRFFLREQKARVGLPEVVRLEVEEHLRSDIGRVIDQLRAQHGRLLRLFGQLRELALPAKDAVDAVIAKVFGELGVEVIEVPFSLPSARSSFLKTIQKLPPSDSTQEFKDGVLWSDCVELLQIDDVCLVTNDRAFYAKHEILVTSAASSGARPRAIRRQPAIVPVHPIGSVESQGPLERRGIEHFFKFVRVDRPRRAESDIKAIRHFEPPDLG